MEGEIKPLLMYFSDKTLSTHQTFCSISDPSKSYSTWNPEFKKSKLLTVQHGWFLWENKISKYVSKLFLWNPCNLNKIILPRLKHHGTIFYSCILSSPPSNNDQPCSIFLFPSYSLSIFYYQLGDKQWTEACFNEDIARVLAMEGKSLMRGKRVYFENPFYWNHRVYAGMWTQDRSIIVVIEKHKLNGFTINCTTDLMHLPTSFHELSHLIVSNNILFRIQVYHERDRVTAVFVFKFDSSQGVWVKVESIKDKVFFISSLDPAFACPVSNPETEGGRIYIALKDCKFFYIYNIEDNCLVTSQHFSNLSETRSYSRWFLPVIGMTTTLKEEIREKKNLCDKAHNEYALPIELLEVIAKHINDVLDYLSFRATNKFLRLAAPPIQWRSSSSMSMSRFDDRSMCPLLVFSKDKVFTFVSPKHGLEYKYIKKFPQDEVWSLNSEICCSKDGWLLLVSVDGTFKVFFNPFTKQVLSFPFWGTGTRNTRCFGMSHSPTSFQCVTLEFVKGFSVSSLTKGYVHHLLEGRNGIFTFEDKEFTLRNVSPAFHNGLFYFLSKTGKLAVVQATRENYSWKVLEELQAPCSSYLNNFLVECDGNLLSVFECPLPNGVQVFKLNESTMTWIKVESLKNHMLFVGKTSFSAVANIPGMENKIYFPRFYGQNLVFYSLETNNYHTFQNDQVVNFHDVREHLNGRWIMPRWH
ncbi:hypothetical protein RYX36_001592 [Vicia faba]